MERNKKVYNSILEIIGQTPVVRLNKITEGLKAEIFAKLEFLILLEALKTELPTI